MKISDEEKKRDEKFTALLLDDQVEETEYAYEEAKKVREMFHKDRPMYDRLVKTQKTKAEAEAEKIGAKK